MSGFDTTLINTTKNNIISDYITEITSIITDDVDALNINNSDKPTLKTNLINKEVEKMTELITDIVTRMYVDIQNQLLNHAVITVNNIVTNVTQNNDTKNITVTIGNATGSISSFSS